MNELDIFCNSLRRTVDSVKQSHLRFATCESVDWGNKTMTAVGVTDNVPYYNVQLGCGYMYIKPAKGTICLIGILEGKDTLTFLINADEVELAEVRADVLDLKTGKNFVIANSSQNLQKILVDFIAEVAKIIVVQGTSPNVPALQAISQRVQNLLK